MAKKKGVSADWKAANYSSAIKVSESTIQGLRAGKTFEGNVAKFKTGATAEQREAMNRFYGKSRVDTALGSPVAAVNKTYTSPGPAFKGVSSTNYTSPKSVTPPKSYTYGPTRGKTPYAPKKATSGPSVGAVANSKEFKNWSAAAATSAAAVASIYGPGKIIKAPKFILGLVKGAKGAKAVPATRTAIALPGRPAPKAIGPGPIGPKAPIALGAGPVGRAAAKTSALDAKYTAAASRAKSAKAAHVKAMKQQRKGLLSSGEVKAVAKTAELERINVGIIANKARASRGLKPNPVKVGPVFQKPTTPRLPIAKKPAGSGKTRASGIPKGNTTPTGKAPKTAKRVATPKQRLKANTASAKEMRKAIAPGASRVTPAGSKSRIGETKVEATRDRFTKQLEKKGDAYRAELRTKYLGGGKVKPRGWEVGVVEDFGGKPSATAVTAASKAAKKRGVEVTVGKSKEAIKAARPKKVAKKVAKKTTTKGKK
jgi:hypothetical protein